MCWKLKNFILRVACLLLFTSWKFKIMFASCEVVFYKLKIYDANFTNYGRKIITWLDQISKE